MNRVKLRHQRQKKLKYNSVPEGQQRRWTDFAICARTEVVGSGNVWELCGRIIDRSALPLYNVVTQQPGHAISNP
jgi:hypothetical protein